MYVSVNDQNLLSISFSLELKCVVSYIRRYLFCNNCISHVLTKFETDANTYQYLNSNNYEE